MLTKKFIAKKGKQLRETPNEWEMRMIKKNPNFKITGTSLHISEIKGVHTVHYEK